MLLGVTAIFPIFVPFLILFQESCTPCVIRFLSHILLATLASSFYVKIKLNTKEKIKLNTKEYEN